MSKSRKTRNRVKPLSQETRAAEAVTVAWTLSVMTTLMCEIAALGLRAIAQGAPQGNSLYVLSGMLFLSSVIIGLVATALIPLVHRLRRDPPPRGFTAFALLICLAPSATLLAIYMQG